MSLELKNSGIDLSLFSTERIKMHIERKWFTIKELATFWKVSTSDIEHLLETKNLKSEFHDHEFIIEVPYRDEIKHYNIIELKRLVPFEFEKPHYAPHCPPKKCKINNSHRSKSIHIDGVVDTEDDIESIYPKTEARASFCKSIMSGLDRVSLFGSIIILSSEVERYELEHKVILNELDALPSKYINNLETPMTAEKYIESLKGENIAVIACKLKNEFPDIIGCEALKLLYPEKVQSWKDQRANLDKDSQKKWDNKQRQKIYTLRKKGEISINMTRQQSDP